MVGHEPQSQPPTTGDTVQIAGIARALVEQAQDIILLLDDDGVIGYVNPTVEAATGWSVDEMLGRNIMDLVHPDDIERALFDLAVYSREGAVSGSSFYRVAMADGTWRLFDASAADISIDGNQQLALYGRPYESASPAVLDGLLRATTMPDMLRPVCDVINWHLHGSRVGIAWREDDGVHTVSTDLPDALAGACDEAHSPWGSVWSSATAQHGADLSLLDAAGRTLAEQHGLGPYWIEPVVDDRAEVCALVTLWMRAGGLPPQIHTLGMSMARDYVELIVRWTRQQRQLDAAAHRDSLTSVANRKAFIDTLEEGADTGAVLYCDLDGFKAVNDALGHNGGDELLRAVARRIQACVRSDDVVARLGGDEFAVLTTGVTRAQVLTLAERIRAAVVEPFKVANATMTVGISIGLTYSVGRVGTEMLELADRGLYQAKASGRNSICWNAEPTDLH